MKSKKHKPAPKHGRLDPNATELFDAMLVEHERMECTLTPSELMSRAVRLYAAAVYGKVTIIERETPPGYQEGTPALH